MAKKSKNITLNIGCKTKIGNRKEEERKRALKGFTSRVMLLGDVIASHPREYAMLPIIVFPTCKNIQLMLVFSKSLLDLR